MIPGMNSRQMKQAMKKMGIKQEEVDAIAVIIRTKTEDIIIQNPSVQKVDMMGQNSYQVSGEEERRPVEEEPDISDEDIETVMSQANVSREEAHEALEEHEGDLAAAILALK